MWKKIHPNYSVSEEGEIRNDRTNKILKGDLNNKGYRRVRISGKTYFNHRSVALMFVPNPDNKPQVNHKDMNKLNNHYSNLEWMTNQENNNHSFDNGRVSSQTKISVSDLKDIIVALDNKTQTPKQLADKYGVKRVTIYSIKQGLNRKRLLYHR